MFALSVCILTESSGKSSKARFLISMFEAFLILSPQPVSRVSSPIPSTVIFCTFLRFKRLRESTPFGGVTLPIILITTGSVDLADSLAFIISPIPVHSVDELPFIIVSFIVSFVCSDT